MLSCRDVAERADALIDGELGPVVTLRLRLHLLMCKNCGRFVEQMRRTRLLIAAAAADPAELPEDAERIEAILMQLGDRGAHRP